MAVEYLIYCSTANMELLQSTQTSTFFFFFCVEMTFLFRKDTVN